MRSPTITTKTNADSLNNKPLAALNAARDLRLVLNPSELQAIYAGYFITGKQKFPITYNAKTKLLRFTSLNNVRFSFQTKTNPYPHLSSALDAAVTHHNSKP